MTIDTESAIRMTRFIRADRQAVWDAWTKPEQMKKWSCPAPGGARTVSTDLRVGGAFTIEMVVDDGAHTAFGTYREVDPPARLVYTWDWKEESHRMGETLVTVEFNEVEGGTQVVLLHEGFPAPEARAGHEEGWGACLMHFEAIFSAG